MPNAVFGPLTTGSEKTLNTVWLRDLSDKKFNHVILTLVTCFYSVHITPTTHGFRVTCLSDMPPASAPTYFGNNFTWFQKNELPNGIFSNDIVVRSICLCNAMLTVILVEKSISLYTEKIVLNNREQAQHHVSSMHLTERAQVENFQRDSKRVHAYLTMV